MLPVCDELIVTEPNNPRKMQANILSEKIEAFSKKTYIEPIIKEAIDKSLSIANPNDVIVFFGSLYMIGEVRAVLRMIVK